MFWWYAQLFYIIIFAIPYVVLRGIEIVASYIIYLISSGMDFIEIRRMHG